MPLRPGDAFDHYRIASMLGEGGMGDVYRAHDARLRRDVALKVLRVRNRGEDVGRFLREARAAAALMHPNVVAIFDVGEREGSPYIAMELVDGRPLTELIRDSRVTIEQKITWLIELARGLAAAHAAGFVHRDIKPDNLMVSKDGIIKILDFGIAKRASVLPPAQAQAGDAMSFRTAPGKVLGTPRYMAPEQVDGELLDGRCDQYAWGVVAHELFSGDTPSKAHEPTRLLTETAPGVPFGIAAIVLRCLGRRPSDRFATMGDVARELGAFLQPGALAPRSSVPNTVPARVVTSSSTMLSRPAHPSDPSQPRAISGGHRPSFSSASAPSGPTLSSPARASQPAATAGGPSARPSPGGSGAIKWIAISVALLALAAAVALLAAVLYVRRLQ